MQITGRLEDWYLQDTYGFGLFDMCGFIYDDIHRRWEDGTWIHSSRIPEPRKDYKEGDLVKTAYSIYLLGKPRGE